MIDSSIIFINKELKHKYSEFNDILIAFDGAPGRIGIGFVGAYSSGIYKAISEKINKGLIYFELKSEINQKIIKDHSQGTTILHASKSIEHLIYAKCSNDELESFNVYFENIILLKKKIKKLEKIKRTLLNKYFN